MGKKKGMSWGEFAGGVCAGLLLGFFFGLLAMAYFFEGFISSINVENMNIGVNETKLVDQMWLRMGPELSRCDGGAANNIWKNGAGG